VSLEDKSTLMLLTEVVTSNKGSRTPAKLGAWLSAGGAIVRAICVFSRRCLRGLAPLMFHFARQPQTFN
jgi:hypothetical protein